jgi:A/G-specific adenine glycosylase
MSSVRPLLAWYRRARRDLPWRRTRDPYAIWVSEVMLQQTQVKTAIPYFERWMRQFPSVRALAGASEDQVLCAWQGLGYYSRARRLLAGAREVVARHGGRLPEDVGALRALPGIGAYSAGAIASIAHRKPEPAVDGNVKRVLCRLYALRGNPDRAPLAREIWRLARELLAGAGAGACPSETNQALMELGATVCTARDPRCDDCPLAAPCLARARGLVSELPQSAQRPRQEKLHMAAAIVSRRGRLLVARVADHAPRWAGMWQFPAVVLAPRETPEHAACRAAREVAGIQVEVEELATIVRHGVTRHRITLEAYRCARARGRARPIAASAVAWLRPSELASRALPSAHRKIAEHLAR